MEDKKFFSCLGIIITAVSLLIFSAVIGGFVLAKLWEWFVVPIFSMQLLTISQAIGLSLVVSYFKTAKDDEDYKNKSFAEIAIESFGKVVVQAAVILTLGWIVYQFI